MRYLGPVLTQVLFPEPPARAEQASTGRPRRRRQLEPVRRPERGAVQPAPARVEQARVEPVVVVPSQEVVVVEPAYAVDQARGRVFSGS